MSTVGRTWKLWAYRYEGGALWHVGAKRWVELHQLGDAPTMIQVRAGSDPKDPRRSMMLLAMCFPYGLDAAVEKGDGNVVALRVAERQEDA